MFCGLQGLYWGKIELSRCQRMSNKMNHFRANLLAHIELSFWYSPPYGYKASNDKQIVTFHDKTDHIVLTTNF